MELRHGGRRYSLSAAEFVIGSSPEATLRLTGEQVFERHVALRQAASDTVLVERAHPDAVIEVNGQVVGSGQVELARGDRLVVGHHWIEVIDPDLLEDGPGPDSSAATLDPPTLSPTQETARPARLVNLSNGHEYSLTGATFVIGGGEDAELRVRSEGARDRQAEIVSRPAGDILIDLSGGATLINGVKVNGRQRLRSLDVVRIGAEEFRYYPPVRVVEVDQPPLPADFRVGAASGAEADRITVAQQGTTRPLAILRVKRGPGKGQRYLVLAPGTTIGRGVGNDIVLSDESVGTRHARLELRERVWVLVEADSHHTTLVDDVEVIEEVPLSPGAAIVLGNVVLSFDPRDDDKGGAPRATQDSSPATGRSPESGSSSQFQRESSPTIDSRNTPVSRPGRPKLRFLPEGFHPRWWMVGLVALAVIVVATAIFWYLP